MKPVLTWLSQETIITAGGSWVAFRSAESGETILRASGPQESAQLAAALDTVLRGIGESAPLDMGGRRVTLLRPAHLTMVLETENQPRRGIDAFDAENLFLWLCRCLGIATERATTRTPVSAQRLEGGGAIIRLGEDPARREFSLCQDAADGLADGLLTAAAWSAHIARPRSWQFACDDGTPIDLTLLDPDTLATLRFNNDTGRSMSTYDLAVLALALRQ